jgi:NADPH-dependent F420 reductase
VPAGSSLSARLASVGFDVVIGSRSRYKALEVRDRLVGRWPGRDLAIDAADNEGAAEADLVVIATPWDAAAATATSVAGALAGKVVISMANALAKVGHEFQPLVPPRGSVAASVQAAVPRSKVAAAFHHVPAKELGDLDHPIESDVLVCSDHRSATEATIEIVTKIPDLRALDSGELSNAAPIEAFAAVLLQLNVRYRTRVAVRFTGIPE